MDENHILRTKFISPLVRRVFWQNDILWKRYREIRNYPLTVIKAGPGYGKSISLATFFKSKFPESYYWYSIDELDADPAIFFLNFLYAFQVKNDYLGREAIEILKNNGEKQVNFRKLLEIFINELYNKVKKDIFLILDDYQLVANNKQINDLMTYFINLMPPKLHLLISTREKLRFKDWAKWRLKEKVLLITEEDLTLSRNEIENFFLEQHGLSLTAEDLDLIQQGTEGWVMALDLIGKQLKSGSGLKEILSNSTASLEILFEYLAIEVLEKQTEPIREFLLKTAVLKYLRVNICNQLLDIDNSEEILKDLNTRGLFVYSLGKGQYRYHHLFHDFLRKQGKKTYDYIGLHKKAADICLKSGERGFAIYHSLGAQDYQQATGLIISSAPKLMELGRLDTLQAALKEVPAELYEKKPLLYIYQGDIYRLRSKFDLALRAYQQAKELFGRSGERLNLSRTLQKIALIYLDTVQPSKADYYLKEALKYRDQDNHWEEAALLKLLAENKANEGRLQEALQLQQKAENLDKQEMSSNNIKARVFLRTGRLNDAQKLLEGKINLEKKRDRLPRSHRESILILSLIYSFKGYYEEAISFARQGVELGQELGSPFIIAVAYMRLGHGLQLAGRHKLKEAREAYQKALAIVDELKVERGRAEPLLGLSLLEAFHGDPHSGLRWAQEGKAIAEKAGDEWLAGLLNLSLGINYYMLTELELARKTFNQGRAKFTEINDKFSLAIILFWLALTYFRLSFYQELEALLSGLFTLIQEGEYNFLFTQASLLCLRDNSEFAPVLLEARDRGLGGNYLKTLLTALKLNNLSSHPGYSLKIKSFGNLRVWRGREEISRREWKREKAQELFLLFLIHRGEYLHKERIYFLLWPEEDEDSASSNFKVTLNALKKALEPNRRPREKSYFIQRRGSNYGLNEGAAVNWDIEEFEKLIAAGDRVESKKEAIEYYRAAVELYEGDFLADNLYLDFVREERERLRNLFLNTADKLLRLYYQQEEYEESNKIAKRILEIDNCWEPAYLYQMRNYYKLNCRTLAIKTYQKCKQVLDRELNVIPMAEIENFYKELIS